MRMHQQRNSDIPTEGLSFGLCFVEVFAAGTGKDLERSLRMRFGKSLIRIIILGKLWILSNELALVGWFHNEVSSFAIISR